jgi:hypothetical protein
MKVYFHECAYQYWTWHDVFLELVLYMKTRHNATIIHEKGHNFQNDGSPAIPKLYVPEFSYHMPDCEIILYDEHSDVLKAITFGEVRTRLIDIFINRNNKNDVLLVSQFNNVFPQEIAQGYTKDTLPYAFAVKNTTFYPFDPKTNMDYFYHQRQFKRWDNLIDKMVCLTTPTTGRLDLTSLNERGVLDYGTGFGYNEYLAKLIQYKIGLAIAGSAEICHREIEYMAIGIPSMHLTYMTQLDPPLIPNVHYIEVSNEKFPKDMWINRNGGPEYVEAYINRFLEVKDDRNFLEFVAHNAREYYFNYCAPNIRLQHNLNLLGV